MKLYIGKVDIETTIRYNKKVSEYVAELVGNGKHVISNKCIPFTKYEKVYFEDKEHIILSDIPFKNELNQSVVLLNNNKIATIEELKKQNEKHGKRVKIQIESGDFCYFMFKVFNEKLNFLEYRGHCPNELKPLLIDYFNEKNELIKKNLENIIYEHESFKKRQENLENRLAGQSIPSC